MSTEKLPTEAEVLANARKELKQIATRAASQYPDWVLAMEGYTTQTFINAITRRLEYVLDSKLKNGELVIKEGKVCHCG